MVSSTWLMAGLFGRAHGKLPGKGYGMKSTRAQPNTTLISPVVAVWMRSQVLGSIPVFAWRLFPEIYFALE
jgi:hypothetical protein